MRLVQRCEGEVRDVVLVYLLASIADPELELAAPRACVANGTGPAFRSSYAATEPARIAPFARARVSRDVEA